MGLLDTEIWGKIKSEIIIPVVSLLFALALLYFLWGVVKYFLAKDSPAEREIGRTHMFWGIVGIAIMLSAFALVNFIFNTVTDKGANKGINNQPIEQPKVIKEGKF